MWVCGWLFSCQAYSIIMSQYNTIWVHVAYTGYPEQGLTLRLTSSLDIITLSCDGSVSVWISANLLPLSLYGLLLLLQPPPHLLLKPLAAFLVLWHRRLHSAQLVQQLEDDRTGMHFPAGWFLTKACWIFTYWFSTKTYLILFRLVLSLYVLKPGFPLFILKEKMFALKITSSTC